MALQLAAAGLRISEATAISTADIRWCDDGTVDVFIHQANVYREGHGEKVGPRRWEHSGEWLIQPNNKTRDRRWVHVDEFGGEILRRRSAATRHPDGLLFYAETREGKMSPVSLSNLRRDLREVTDETDLDWASTHTMRRSVATEVHREYGIEMAQKTLNHESVSTTVRSYIGRETTAPDVRDVTSQFGRARQKNR